MKELFPRKVYRDSKGRFATAQTAYYDKLKRENEYLRFELEKERRKNEALLKLQGVRDNDHETCIMELGGTWGKMV